MSGISINVRSNSDSVAMEFLASAQEMRDTAMVRALNKMADQVKVAASREIRAVGYKLKAKDVKDAMRVQRASSGNLRAAVVAKGRPIPLVRYGARMTAKGVSVDVLKGRKVIAGAFIAVMPSGHKGVYVREPNAKHVKKITRGKPSWHALPIRELFGPSIPDGMSNEAVKDAVDAIVADRFPRILEHEHTWLRRRLNAKAV